MSSKIETNARYQKTHEWVRAEGNGELTVGISDHAQHSMSDLVFAEAQVRVGQQLKAGEVFGVVESVKAASDVYMPADGTVTAANNEINSSPELINTDPYGKGWMIRFKPANASDLDKLFSAAQYEEFLKTEEH